MAIKPILFNTEMVRALLDGRKSVTRRVVKPQPPKGFIQSQEASGQWFFNDEVGDNDMMEWWPSYEKGIVPPYRPGDILYVRETWSDYDGGYIYKTHCAATKMLMEVRDAKILWRPSIHMPKEAARLFLRVMGVRVERLQDIDDQGAKAEGANWRNGKNVGWEEKMRRSAIERFAELWDSTIKKADLHIYGWASSPWVWVIEFERISKEEALRNAHA